jgi:predicted nucleotidyltransferase
VVKLDLRSAGAHSAQSVAAAMTRSIRERAPSGSGTDLGALCYDVTMREAATVNALADIGTAHAHLRLLVLFGSQARGEARPGSDWDLGYLAGAGFDPDALLLDLVTRLGTDRVDLVDLARAGAQLRFRAAAEGRVLHESQAGCFEKLWLEAVHFWCDAGPLIRDGYAHVLARLRP